MFLLRTFSAFSRYSSTSWPLHTYITWPSVRIEHAWDAVNGSQRIKHAPHCVGHPTKFHEMFRQKTYSVSLPDVVLSLILLTNEHMHSYLSGVMSRSLEIRGWLRQDGDRTIYSRYRCPNRTGTWALGSLPVSSTLSVLAGWLLHSRLLPPAAAYSKTHTSLSKPF